MKTIIAIYSMAIYLFVFNDLIKHKNLIFIPLKGYLKH